MRPDKMGEFITRLRKEKNMTQEQLAELIPISRTAISKWERGINIPDPTSLGKLREIFEVSVDELFYGERINKNNKNAINEVSLNLYKSKRKGKKVIVSLIFLLIATLISFLAYYLIMNYKSIHVYSINGESEEFNMIEGTFIKTNYKLFFDIQNMEIDNLKSIRLYYIDNNKNEINIFTGEDFRIHFIDYVGYDEYLDSKKIDYIIENMYLEIFTNDKSEKIKLNFNEDYVNDDLFISNENKISKELSTKNKQIIDNNYDLIIKNIKSKYNKHDDGYTYELKDKNYNYTFIYWINEKIITISKNENNNGIYTENFTLYLDNNNLEFVKEVNDEIINSYRIDLSIIKCDIETVDKCNIVNEFWNIINKSFK